MSRYAKRILNHHGQGRLERRFDCVEDAVGHLHQLLTKLYTCSDQRAASEEILCAAMEITHADMGIFQIADPQSQTLSIVAQRGFAEDVLIPFQTVKLYEHGAYARAVNEGRQFVLEDIQQSPGFAFFQDMAASAGFRSLLSIPLICPDGTLAGVLSTHHRNPVCPLPGVLQMLDLYARVAADFIDRSRREQALAESRGRQAFLLALSDQLRPLSNAREVADAAAQALGEHLGVERVGYVSIAQDGEIIQEREGWAAAGVSSYAGYHHLSELSEVMAAEINQGRTIMINDVAEVELTTVDAAAFAQNDVRAVLAAPILKEGRFVGGLYATQRTARQWKRDEAALIQEVAERTWSAIERAQAEEALRKSEERFRALVTACSEVLYCMGPDWREMRELYSRGFLTTTPRPNSNWLQEYIHPDDQSYVTAVINDAIRTKSVFELGQRVIRMDGSLGWTLSRAVPLMDDNGHILEWFGAAIDITERIRAEEALGKAKAAAEEASRA